MIPKAGKTFLCMSLRPVQLTTLLGIWCLQPVCLQALWPLYQLPRTTAEKLSSAAVLEMGDGNDLLSNHVIIFPSAQLKRLLKCFQNRIFQTLNHLFPATIMFTKQSFYCFLPHKGSSDGTEIHP